jgi:anaphase-promoting complex subunit 1
MKNVQLFSLLIIRNLIVGDELLSGALSGSNLAETLYYHMVGGPRPSEGGRPKFRSPSYQIQEGESINIDVTSPGATLALGLMFLRSGLS